jgi:hypothetical protein
MCSYLGVSVTDQADSKSFGHFECFPCVVILLFNQIGVNNSFPHVCYGRDQPIASHQADEMDSSDLLSSPFSLGQHMFDVM